MTTILRIYLAAYFLLVASAFASLSRSGLIEKIPVEWLAGGITSALVAGVAGLYLAETFISGTGNGESRRSDHEFSRRSASYSFTPPCGTKKPARIRTRVRHVDPRLHQPGVASSRRALPKVLATGFAFPNKAFHSLNTQQSWPCTRADDRA
jgi:hypothetical protein